MDVRLAKNVTLAELLLGVFQPVFQGGLWGTESAMKEVILVKLRAIYFFFQFDFFFLDSKIG